MYNEFYYKTLIILCIYLYFIRHIILILICDISATRLMQFTGRNRLTFTFLHLIHMKRKCNKTKLTNKQKISELIIARNS